MTVYILYDEDDIESVHKTREGAREALVQFLCDHYTQEELELFAQQDGYKTLEDYLTVILKRDDFDNSYDVEVEEFELKD